MSGDDRTRSRASAPPCPALDSRSATHQAVVDVREPAYMFLVNGLIHDNWFAVTDVQYDRNAGLVTVPFMRDEDEKWRLVSRGPADRTHRAPGILRCLGVTALSLTETQFDGSYDFNELRFDPSSNVLTVETGIPVEFRMSVSSLHIQVRIGARLEDASVPTASNVSWFRRLFGHRRETR